MNAPSQRSGAPPGLRHDATPRSDNRGAGSVSSGQRQTPPGYDTLTPVSDMLDAAERSGRETGWRDGYVAGFDAGAEVGGAQTLLGIEHALSGELPNLLPRLPYVGAYLDYRKRTELNNDPCAQQCRRCSRCIRADSVRSNLARYGTADYPGIVTAKAVADRERTAA